MDWEMTPKKRRLRMKPMKVSCLCFLLFFLFPLGLTAAGDLTEADKLFDQGGLENYQQAIELYLKVLAENSDDYEANWKCARAYREYGDEAKTKKVEGWKQICAQYGKTGMSYAQKAIELEPDKPDGYYYYGLNVGIYSDGVSVLTALAEGLKDKTQSSFEKTYALNKMYNKAGPMLSLGRFWAVLPWPYRDRKKALQYYREYQTTEHFADNIEAHVYLGELLIEIGGEDNKTEAKGYLEKAAASDDPYYRDQAKELLSKLK
jgi:tetratricopeptide (TPR) repeat protein